MLKINNKYTETLEWRNTGPFRGGRVVAAAGDPEDQMVFYFGACGGGVWKTEDGGVIWENISDNYFNSASIGALAVSNSDPNVIYVGTGESCIRGNVISGDGVYKSNDKGITWKNIGLKETKHISRIRIHPSNPDLVYVAALGHIFGSNEERGVFRSKDGGKNWEKILYVSKNAGSADLSIDINNPRIIFASIWETKREPHTFTSGGEDSGLYKSTDSGDTWEKLDSTNGLPEGIMGRIGVSISASKSGRVWALIESKDRGLFRSEDYGNSWVKISDNADIIQRPWYYTHIYSDPNDSETVYALNYKMWKSTDGGVNFNIMATPHGDNHELWIDPNNSNRMIQGNDGGACVSFNAGKSWSSIYNQPTSQFYHLDIDNKFPFNLYATQQDNSAICVPSRTTHGGILWSDCYQVGTSESGHIAVDPKDSDIVYSGAIGSSSGGGDSLLKYNHKTKQTRIVSIWPEVTWGHGAKDHKYRFQWTYPIVFSKHNLDKIYVTANVVFKSENGGQSWKVISPDLTRNDKTKMIPSGGPITLDVTMVENYGTIFSFAESPHDENILWAGSDDGLINISFDMGETWNNITPLNIPDDIRIDNIEISQHNQSTAYISCTRYKFDDDTPYLYKTNDYGKNWKLITNGIPDNDFTRIIREDPVNKELLYAGTENGVYISFDDGNNWEGLQMNLPAVPISDMKIKDDELIVATNGRGFWILNNLNVLRQINKENIVKNSLFKPSDTYRIFAGNSPTKDAIGQRNYGFGLGKDGIFIDKKQANNEINRKILDGGTNPPDGVAIHYYLSEKNLSSLILSVHDDQDKEIATFKPSSGINDNELNEKHITTNLGLNKFIWSMRYSDALQVNYKGAIDHGLQGPIAPPGKYKAKLFKDKQLIECQEFNIIKDPRIESTNKDLISQFEFLIKVRNKISETSTIINKCIDLRDQLSHSIKKIDKNNKDYKKTIKNIDKFLEKLSNIENSLIDYNTIQGNDRLSSPATLYIKIRELSFVPALSDDKPTDQSVNVLNFLSKELDKKFEDFKKLTDLELKTLIKNLDDIGLPIIKI